MQLFLTRISGVKDSQQWRCWLEKGISLPEIFGGILCKIVIQLHLKGKEENLLKYSFVNIPLYNKYLRELTLY